MEAVVPGTDIERIEPTGPENAVFAVIFCKIMAIALMVLLQQAICQLIEFALGMFIFSNRRQLGCGAQPCDIEGFRVFRVVSVAGTGFELFTGMG